MIAFLLLALALDVIRENPNQVGRGPDRPINEGCEWVGAGLECPLLEGTHVYSVQSSRNIPILKNRTTKPLSITRVQSTNEAPAPLWAEASAYLDGMELCLVPMWYPGRLGGSMAPCQKDIDLGPGVRRAGNVGAVYEGWGTRRMGDMAWPGDLAVPPGSSVYLHDNPSEAIATMYTVTARAGDGSIVLRQPPIDNYQSCDGKDQGSPWDPWEADADYFLTGAQVYAIGAPENPAQVRGACLYVIETVPTWKVLWQLCSFTGWPGNEGVRTTGSFAFPERLVRKGELIVGHAVNRCDVTTGWGYAVFITARRAML